MCVNKEEITHINSKLSVRLLCLLILLKKKKKKSLEEIFKTVPDKMIVIFLLGHRFVEYFTLTEVLS